MRNSDGDPSLLGTNRNDYILNAYYDRPDDQQKFKKIIEIEKEIIEWRYYVALKDDDEKMQKYLRYLNNIGFNTITKPLKKLKLEKKKKILFIKLISMLR